MTSTHFLQQASKSSLEFLGVLFKSYILFILDSSGTDEPVKLGLLFAMFGNAKRGLYNQATKMFAQVLKQEEAEH